jgi:DNA-binding NarL/FixJ family response regulator
VIVVDDHADFRAQAAELLEAAGYEVVGSCADGRSALAAIAMAHPDVVLLDIQLPDIDGFAVTAQLAPGSSRPVVVLTSTRDAGDYGGRIVRSGAAGFISKAELSAQSLACLVPGP